MMRPLSWLWLAWLGLAACQPAAVQPPGASSGPPATPFVATPTLAVVAPTSSAVDPSPVPLLTASWPTPGIPSPTALLPDSGWETLRPGLERRRINLYAESGLFNDTLYILRLDPALFRFELGYRPGQPQRLEAWLAETGALIVCNGGFFTPEFTATGLIIVDGAPSGISYQGFGGMLTIVDGVPAVRGLAQQPYDPQERFDAALQAFPLLIEAGGRLAYDDDSPQRARRSVFALDRDGRVVLLVADRSQFTLAGLGRYLLESDLNLDIALNLDGGPSSGLLVREPAEGVPAYVSLPGVILVFPR